MEPSTLWWLAALGLVLLELLSATFYLLMLTLGAVAAALAAHLGAGLSIQLVCAAVVGSLAVGAWHLRRSRRPAAQRLDLDLGQEITVEHWGPHPDARVRYRGADWVASLAPGQSLSPSGRYRVVAIEGNRLILAAH